MIRRLSLYEFYFRICCFLLPVVAFLISAIGLRSLDWIDPLGHDYLYLCVTLTLVWVLCSVHFEITNVEELFLDSIGVRNCLKVLPGRICPASVRCSSIARLPSPGSCWAAVR